MKTILTKLQVLSLIFLFQNLFYAQNEELYAYRGGAADGFATESVETQNCQTPNNLVAYFGGAGDGEGMDTLADNASCSTPFNQFAYFGGSGDGAATDDPALLNCSTPYHFFAYFGGDGDGASEGKTTDVCPIDPPVADFTADETTTCVGHIITFTDTSTNKPTGWTWTFEGGTPATASTKTVGVTYGSPGVYKVTLTAANNIGSNTVTKPGYITVLADCTTLGTAPEAQKVKMQVYPNPTKNILYIKSDEIILNVELFDLAGKKILEANPKHMQTQLNIQQIPAGMYLLRMQTAAGMTVSKVIKSD
ncbi:T9SS type A sorting domain-containing protein [Kaistella palustris]|uniref:T9SS type A sorting domain-containing protein n=1 Tax=Kaistella palustris TaxID=493376 RepID=UPI000A037C76|nr:T9SS type A sorting domain-containing protein [Kaistella palustris]